MQIAQSEILCMINNNCIRIRNVKPRLDDGGGNQHIKFTVDKAHHHIFELFTFHLSMSDNSADSRNNLFDNLFNFIYIRHTVMEKKHLTITGHLILYGLTYDFLVKIVQFGLDRVSVWRRSLYNRQISCTHHRKLQCSRNGSGSQG